MNAKYSFKQTIQNVGDPTLLLTFEPQTTQKRTSLVLLPQNDDVSTYPVVKMKLSK